MITEEQHDLLTELAKLTAEMAVALDNAAALIGKLNERVSLLEARIDACVLATVDDEELPAFLRRQAD